MVALREFMTYTAFMRFGFVLADLFAGSSVNLWPAVAGMFPDSGSDSLVIFPGGRLSGSSPLERMKNSIYDFVTPEDLAGLIIWCSTLTGEVSKDDVIDRFRSMIDLPFVTIDGKTERFPSIPDVRFNAYEGSRDLVRHCISVHGFRRIAYVRGPENHASAQSRFKAYRDALDESGIEYDPELVADPAPWSKGAESIRQLMDERGKRPGKDFDVVLFASDLMLYSAMQEMKARGLEPGRDVLACGFNDSIESRLAGIPVTTVRMPASELGRSAVRSFRDVICGRPCPDKELPAVPVIRRSCGCNGMTSWKGKKSTVEMADSISDHFRIPRDVSRTIVEKAALNPTEKNVMDLVEILCTDGADIFAITKVLGGIMELDAISAANRHVLSEAAREMLPSVLDRKMSERSYSERSRRRAFNVFNNELLEANKVSTISEILERNASALGFDRLILMNNDSLFPDTPGDGSLDHGVWIAAPLCTETEIMGHLLMKPVVFDGAVCEEIRSVVSSALRSSMLFETTRRAQMKAEEAEQAKTAFFVNVGENLRDPLSEILQLVTSSSLDVNTRRSIVERITGTNNIIDLALAETDELELYKYSVNIGSLLSSFDCFEATTALPCLMIDENRITQAVQAIVSSMGEDVSIKASMHRKGVRIDISGTGGGAGSGHTALALARRIIIMHNGTIVSDGNDFSFFLPYPSLSGDAPMPWPEDGVLACLGGHPAYIPDDVLCEEIGGARFAESGKLPPAAGAVYWAGDFRGYSAVSAIRILVSDANYRSLPFICMDCPRSRTMEDSLRSAVEESGRKVLLVGIPAESSGSWLVNSETVTCGVSDALWMCRTHEPALVVVSTGTEVDTASALGLLNSLRSMGGNSQTPVVLVSDSLDRSFVQAICDVPNVIAVNTCILESEEFSMRIRAVLGGSVLLSPNTGAIVKRAQAFICSNATSQISRWQIAGEVNVSEDYLTRMFKKELGLSPWDYLNRYRIWLACGLLKNSGMLVNEVSEATGFQDQAYFCRVFKKIKGFSPKRMRNTGNKSEIYKK